MMTTLEYPAPRAGATPAARPWFLAVEMALIFFAAPVLVLTGLWPQKGVMLLLAVGTAYTIWVAWRGGARKSELGLGRSGWRGAWPTVWVGLGAWLVAVGVAAAVHLALGKRAFPLVADRPSLFFLFGLVYAGSVSAQEFVFRSFFFWRYRSLLPASALLALNALSFGWVHIVFGSWVSVGLTVAGGVVFAALFVRFRSFPGACVVHAAFGLTVFAMGYGIYFWSGSGEIARMLLSASH